MAVLKANAYGHGLEAVARCLAPQADAFGVALVEEGIALRRLGIPNPILVMGGIWTRQIPLFLEHDLTFTVPSLARLADIEQAAAARGARARVHLQIDTGMERIGTHHYSAAPLLEAAARSPHVEVAGIYSHFANADAADLAHARLQLERFLEVLRSTSATRSPRRCGTSRTRPRSCACPSPASTWSGRACCSTASTPRETHGRSR
jgi:alanine racemase